MFPLILFIFKSRHLSPSTPYLPSTLAYPNHNRMLDTLLSAPVSSTSSTFTLPTSNVMFTASATTVSFASLPPKSSILSSATLSVAHSSAAPLPLLREDAVATCLTFNNSMQFGNSHRTCNNESPVIQNNNSCLQVKLAHP